MPGFFEGFKRLLMGEEVFRPGESPRVPDDAPVMEYNDELPKPEEKTATAVVAPKPAEKEYPEVVIDRFECYVRDGGKMEINLFLRNLFHDKIWVEYVLLFGQKHNVDHELEPGEMREFPAYNGPLMDNKYYTTAEVYYRTEPGGDYFSAMHNVEFQERQDQRFVPAHIRFYPPVKDR